MGRPKKSLEDDNFSPSPVKQPKTDTQSKENLTTKAQRDTLSEDGEGVTCGGNVSSHITPSTSCGSAPLYEQFLQGDVTQMYVPEDFAATLPDTAGAQAQPDLDKLLEFALEEQENLQNVPQCCSRSRNIKSQESDSNSGISSVGSSDYVNYKNGDEDDVTIPDPSDNFVAEMFDHRFWQHEHTLSGHEGLSSVQAQLIHLLCASYNRLHRTTNEPPRTAEYFLHSSKVSKAVLLHCCPGRPSCLAHLNRIGWAT